MERVGFLHLEFVGPGKVLLMAAVDLAGDAPEPEVATRLREIATRIEEHELVARAFLTLAVAADPTLVAG